MSLQGKASVMTHFELDLPQRERDPETNVKVDLEAVLRCAGEAGFRETSVGAICRSAGIDRSQFYGNFRSKEQCFAIAYEAAMSGCVANLEEVMEEGETAQEGIMRALEAIAVFARRRPAVARALVLEVHVAGEGALLRRRELFNRLARSLDRICRVAGASPEAPAGTAEFLVHAIDQTLGNVIQFDHAGRFADSVPELSQFVGIYFGLPDA